MGDAKGNTEEGARKEHLTRCTPARRYTPHASSSPPLLSLSSVFRISPSPPLSHILYILNTIVTLAHSLPRISGINISF